jgi:succinoglycan biosynthesis transport protein ExoP
VTDALKNETIIKLRAQYVDMAAKEAVWAAKYGRDHLAALNLRTQMRELKKNMVDELRRIQESQKSDYDIAQTREQSIKDSLAMVVSESQLTNRAQVQLRELESNAQSYQAMYDNFLQRYMESVQQQSFPITEARVISAATRPLNKSQPKSLIILAASLLGGLVLAFGAAMARELADNVFRTSSQVEEGLQTTCISIVPQIGASAKPLGALPNRARKEATPDGAAMLRYVVDHPLSRFSEALRSVKVAIDLNSIVRQNRVIAITSTLPNEGKSTISSNLAQLIAHSGAKVLLVDSDLRNPSLSRDLCPQHEVGLVDVIGNKVTIDDAIMTDPVTQLAFLPAGSARLKLLHTNEVLASKLMQGFIEQMKARFDYIIIDMPPMAPVVDVRVTSSFVDSYLFVVEWGQTKTDVIRHNLKGAPELYDRLLGVVLNKADTKLLARYESYQGKYYYSRYYARYGYTE